MQHRQEDRTPGDHRRVSRVSDPTAKAKIKEAQRHAAADLARLQTASRASKMLHSEGPEYGPASLTSLFREHRLIDTLAAERVEETTEGDADLERTYVQSREEPLFGVPQVREDDIQDSARRHRRRRRRPLIHLNGFGHLKILRISNYHIHLDNDLLADLKELKSLTLWNTYIKHLAAKFLYFTPKLIELELSDNNLRRIESITFDKMTNLTHLDLRKNYLTEFPAGIFDKLVALRHLDVSINNLSNLPENIFAKLKNLNYLSLKKNNFINLPRNLLRNNAELFVVNLSHNQRNLILLDGLFSNLTKLKFLPLNNNGLVTLPEDLFWRSSSLEMITLSNNYLQSLPVEIFRGLSTLERLKLDSNYLEAVPNIFKNIGGLRILNLSKYRFTTISEYA
ncbi:carboxypeptidase N subunit 2-like [Linepithema humile]|uniref:carboxypeptidase N subunit 2-like n=1 Tax=Linepithema humile TaxID=83485 RepID=UPI00351DBB4A